MNPARGSAIIGNRKSVSISGSVHGAPRVREICAGRKCKNDILIGCVVVLADIDGNIGLVHAYRNGECRRVLRRSIAIEGDKSVGVVGCVYTEHEGKTVRRRRGRNIIRLDLHTNLPRSFQDTTAIIISRNEGKIIACLDGEYVLGLAHKREALFLKRVTLCYRQESKSECLVHFGQYIADDIDGNAWVTAIARRGQSRKEIQGVENSSSVKSCILWLRRADDSDPKRKPAAGQVAVDIEFDFMSAASRITLVGEGSRYSKADSALDNRQRIFILIRVHSAPQYRKGIIVGINAFGQLEGDVLVLGVFVFVDVDCNLMAAHASVGSETDRVLSRSIAVKSSNNFLVSVAPGDGENKRQAFCRRGSVNVDIKSCAEYTVLFRNLGTVRHFIEENFVVAGFNSDGVCASRIHAMDRGQRAGINSEDKFLCAFGHVIIFDLNLEARPWSRTCHRIQFWRRNVNPKTCINSADEGASVVCAIQTVRIAGDNKVYIESCGWIDCEVGVEFDSDGAAFLCI